MQRGNESPFFIFTFFVRCVDIVCALLYIICIESETVTKTWRLKMKQFEVGKKYTGRFISDSDAIITAEIVKVTAKTVVAMVTGEGEVRAKIHNDGESFFFYPLGRYSMAPIIRSN